MSVLVNFMSAQSGERLVDGSRDFNRDHVTSARITGVPGTLNPAVTICMMLLHIT